MMEILKMEAEVVSSLISEFRLQESGLLFRMIFLSNTISDNISMQGLQI
jgi:hypothetical protein